MLYNVDKGGNTSEESEILEPIHACLRELIEWDKAKKTHLIRYTDHDIVAITLLYVHILGNRIIHTLSDEKVSVTFSKEIVENYVDMVKKLTLAMSRVNVSEHFKDGKTKE